MLFLQLKSFYCSESFQVTTRTKDLEKETLKWQNRWEESTKALKLMKENHDKLQGELLNSEQSLEKMKGLCRALQSERKELLEELKDKLTKDAADARIRVAEKNAALGGKPLNLQPLSENKENTVTTPKKESESDKSIESPAKTP